MNLITNRKVAVNRRLQFKGKKYKLSKKKKRREYRYHRVDHSYYVVVLPQLQLDRLKREVLNFVEIQKKARIQNAKHVSLISIS